jgi:hypothetical protein
MSQDIDPIYGTSPKAPLDPTLMVPGLGPSTQPYGGAPPWGAPPAEPAATPRPGATGYGRDAVAAATAVPRTAPLPSMMAPPAVDPGARPAMGGPAAGLTKPARIAMRPVVVASHRPQTTLVALLVPALLLGAGGAGAAYLALAVEIWPLAVLSGLLGVVAALFAFVMLRG